MSFFDRQGIPESLLKPINDGPTAQAIRTSVPDDSEADDSDERAYSAFEDDVAMLRNFCLIQISPNGQDFEMHRLVQLSTRKWLAIGGLEENFKQKAVLRLAATFPEYRDNYGDWPECQKLFAHVESVSEYKVTEGVVEEVWASLLYNGAHYMLSQGKYDVAERMGKMAMTTHEKRLGRDNDRTLESMKLVASVLEDRGLLEDAAQLGIETTGRFKARLGAKHNATLASMNNLASIYWRQHRFEEAERLLAEVYEGLKASLGAEHPKTLLAMNNLAVIYSDRGRLDEAEQLLAPALKAMRASAGDSHPATLAAMNGLGSLYLDQGRLDDAEEWLVRALEGRRQTLGANHPDTLRSLNNVAMLWERGGRLNDALVLMLDCAKARIQALGAEHPDTVSSVTALALWTRKCETAPIDAVR